MNVALLYKGTAFSGSELVQLFLSENEKQYVSKNSYRAWVRSLIDDGKGTFLFSEEPSMQTVMEKQEQTIRQNVTNEKKAIIDRQFPKKKNKNKRKELMNSKDMRMEIDAETRRRFQAVQNWDDIYERFVSDRKQALLEKFFAQTDPISLHNKKIDKAFIESLHYPEQLQIFLPDMVEILQTKLDSWLKSGEKTLESDPFYDDYDEHDDDYDDYYDDDYYDDDDWDYNECDLTERNIGDFVNCISDFCLDPILFYEIVGSGDLNMFILDYMEEHLPDLKNASRKLINNLPYIYVRDISDCEDKIMAQIDSSANHILSCLSQNPLYHSLAEEEIIRKKRREAERKQEEERLEQEKRRKEEYEKRIQESILHVMPEHYPDLYPLARKMSRHFVLHIGPTNSGKTYAAMQRLRETGEGIYLAPLRLLAYEQYEALNADGIPCSLITGEEKAIREGARIQASTVEMMNPVQEYPVAVLDEAQMIEDRDRGWAWTAAILGLCCPEIHVCASSFTQGLLQTLIQECGDTFEVIKHERQTELLLDPKMFHFPKDVRKHDALIVFSKKNVHAVAHELKKQGKSCSIIYGNLPYDVRQSEVRRFASGETDVLVSTDAIGMGLNLPIERVVFLETSKFDGQKVRPLKPAEVKQIAGRAGRMGIFEKGYYAGNPKIIQEIFQKKTKPLTTAVIGFPESLVGLDAKLSDIVKQWNHMPVPNGYVRMNTVELRNRMLELEQKTENKQLIYDFATMPFNEKGEERSVWKAMFRKECCGEPYTLEDADQLYCIRNCKRKLSDLETAYKICDLLYIYFNRFEHMEDIDELLSLKKTISYSILDKLSRQELEAKKCKHCGRIMPWNHPYGMCDKCHQAQRSMRSYAGWSDWGYDAY